MFEGQQGGQHWYEDWRGPSGHVLHSHSLRLRDGWYLTTHARAFYGKPQSLLGSGSSHHHWATNVTTESPGKAYPPSSRSQSYYSCTRWREDGRSSTVAVERRTNGRCTTVAHPRFQTHSFSQPIFNVGVPDCALLAGPHWSCWCLLAARASFCHEFIKCHGPVLILIDG